MGGGVPGFSSIKMTTKYEQGNRKCKRRQVTYILVINKAIDNDNNDNYSNYNNTLFILLLEYLLIINCIFNVS